MIIQDYIVDFLIDKLEEETYSIFQDIQTTEDGISSINSMFDDLCNLKDTLLKLKKEGKSLVINEDTKKITRFEVIDHRENAKEFGRAFVANDIKLDLSFQDDNKTLKVFIKEKEDNEK